VFFFQTISTGGFSMLCLSRKSREEIVIGDNIRIQILSIRGDKVRIGITAPPDLTVHRKEVFDLLSKGKTDADGT